MKDIIITKEELLNTAKIDIFNKIENAIYNHFINSDYKEFITSKNDTFQDIIFRFNNGTQIQLFIGSDYQTGNTGINIMINNINKLHSNSDYGITINKAFELLKKYKGENK